jgi:2-phosphosulfolactate phosphatase
VRADVFFGPATLHSAELQGRLVVVIDVLRASSTIVVALANGARTVIPFDSTDEVITRSKSFQRSEVILAGERKMRTVPGFDLGNSPSEFTPERVVGRTILFSTSNGTAALLALQGARDVLIGSFLNFSAVLAMVRSACRSGIDVALVCAGSDGQFALEDAVCAGHFVRGMTKRMANVALNDAARVAALADRRYAADLRRAFEESSHGRALADAGYGDDLLLCASVDTHPVVPVYADRQITRLGTDRGR